MIYSISFLLLNVKICPLTADARFLIRLTVLMPTDAEDKIKAFNFLCPNQNLLMFIVMFNIVKLKKAINVD